MKRISVIYFFLFCLAQVSAQNHFSRFGSYDVQNYIFDIHLNDSTNRIEGKTTIKIRFLKPTQKVILDLIGRNDSTSSGMEVSQIYFNGNPVKFSHQNDQLEIDFNQIFEKGDLRA